MLHDGVVEVHRGRLHHGDVVGAPGQHGQIGLGVFGHGNADGESVVRINIAAPGAPAGTTFKYSLMRVVATGEGEGAVIPLVLEIPGRHLDGIPQAHHIEVHGLGGIEVAQAPDPHAGCR